MAVDPSRQAPVVNPVGKELRPERSTNRFYDLIDMREELEGMFGCPVDLVERRLVESSENYIRRKHILSNLETIYVA